jgi:hypothetical protein
VAACTQATAAASTQPHHLLKESPPVSNYLMSKAVAGPSFCVLRTPQNMPDATLLRKGVRLAPWPGDVQFHMDPTFPKAIQLPDWVKNMSNALVASPALKKIIEASAPPDMEYLPITLIDHQGRVASSDYFMLNPCSLQDAINQELSTIEWNAIDPTFISDCTSMVLDESRIDPHATVFRLKHYPSKVVFRRDLANTIKKAGCTGIKFVEIEDVDC